jgi:cytidine deaminase
MREKEKTSEELNSIWNFKQVKKIEEILHFVSLPEKLKKRIKDYDEVLRVASASEIADPIFSKYFVKEAIGPEGMTKIPAGNIEYGYKQALHGEEAAITAFRRDFNDYGGKQIILGIVAGEEGNIPSPCGNCRDFLSDFAYAEQIDVVSGTENGGIATVSSFKDYLFDDYRVLKPEMKKLKEIDFEVRRIRDLAKRWTYDPDSSSSSLFPERNYQVLLRTINWPYHAGHRVGADYHPVYAIENAIILSGSDVAVDHLTIVSNNSE